MNVNRPTSHSPIEDRRFLVFSLGNEQFAIPLLKVKEVIAAVETRPVPQSPPHFKGLLDLRGLVISIIDLRTKMKINKKEVGATPSIIILDYGTEPLGVIVDSVDYVFNLNPDEISPPPTIHSGTQSDFITGVFSKDKKMILLLDILSALGVDELKLLKKQTEQSA